MSDRVSQHVVLCEDDAHSMLVCAYLRKCGIGERERTIINTSESHHGGIASVLDQFPMQLKACRQRHKRARTLLIVVADADAFSVTIREQHFQEKEAFTDGDPLVILIPKRHVETWICAAIDKPVEEDENCKHHNLSKNEIHTAARRIYEWARNEPPDESTCVASLRAALPRWRKIG